MGARGIRVPALQWVLRGYSEPTGSAGGQGPCSLHSCEGRQGHPLTACRGEGRVLARRLGGPRTPSSGAYKSHPGSCGWQAAAPEPMPRPPACAVLPGEPVGVPQACTRLTALSSPLAARRAPARVTTRRRGTKAVTQIKCKGPGELSAWRSTHMPSSA